MKIILLILLFFNFTLSYASIFPDPPSGGYGMEAARQGNELERQRLEIQLMQQQLAMMRQQNEQMRLESDR